jgi:type IV pilus assembly protein PilF
MRLHKYLLVACIALVTGCVTTTTGDSGRMPASSEEQARINRDLGIRYLEMGDVGLAVVKLEKSLKEDPDNADTHRTLGTAYLLMGDEKTAEQEFRKAVRLAPEDPNALNQLGAFLCQRGETEEALKYFDKGIAIPRFQGRFTINTNAGTCVKKEDLERAEGYLRAALAESPNYYEALYQMADVAFLQKNYLQARAFFERRMAAAQPTADVLWLGFQIETAMGDMQAAENYSGLILSRYPESVEARMLLESQRDAG